MLGARRAGAAALLIIATFVASSRAQTVLPDQGELPPGATVVIVPPPDAPVVIVPPPDAPAVIVPAPAAPAPAIEYAPAPPTVQRLPPGSARDANRLDAPSETLKKAGQVVEDLAKGDIKALRRGPLLIHGNYCGIGNKPGLPPVDALDAACARHDACTKTGSLPSCACNERLEHEAAAIADDPSRTEELRTLASATAASMAILICK